MVSVPNFLISRLEKNERYIHPSYKRRCKIYKDIPILLSILICLNGIMCLKGFFHKKKLKGIFKFVFIDLDKLIFPNLSDENVLKKADKMGFAFCAIMSLVSFFAIEVDYLLNNISVTRILVYIALFGLWPLRIMYIYFSLPRARFKQEI